MSIGVVGGTHDATDMRAAADSLVAWGRCAARPPDRDVAGEHVENLPLLVALTELAPERRVEVGFAPWSDLEQNVHLALAQPARIVGLQRRPGIAAAAVDLAAFDGKVDVAAAGITGDDLEFGTEQVV